MTRTNIAVVMAYRTEKYNSRKPRTRPCHDDGRKTIPPQVAKRANASRAEAYRWCSLRSTTG